LAGTVCYVSWSGSPQFVFVVICGAWVVCKDRVFLHMFRGQAAITDSEEMFSVCGKKNVLA